MGPLEMDFPETFAGFKCESVADNVCHPTKDNLSDMKHSMMETKHDNVAVDSFLGFGMENMGINSKMEEFSHGFDFSFLPDYGGLDSCSFQDREAGLKLEILDGFLDEVDEVEDIYASSSICDYSLPETEAKKNVSELDGGPCGLMNFSSESYSPGISGCIGLSEWSKAIVPHSESNNLSSERVKDSLDMNSNNVHCFYESEDDKKPLSTFIGSWIKRRKGRTKKLLNTTCSRLDSFGGTMSRVSYDFRPRRGPLKKHIHATAEDALFDDQLTSSESEDDDSVVINTSKSRSDRRKHQRMWTIEEVVKLVDGISHFGVGKWTDIKNLFFHSSSYRTPVDIRDKWRNLLKASYTQKHKNVDGEAEEKRRSAGRTIPKDILNRVRELASLHPYPFSKTLCLVHGSSRSQSISKKKKKRS